MIYLRAATVCLALVVGGRAARGGEAEAAERVYRGLHQPVSWSFHELPLAEFAQRLTREAGFPVLIDGVALEDARIAKGLTISAEAEGEPLGEVLWRLLGPYGLTVRIGAGSLWITTADEAQNHLQIRHYALPEAHEDWCDESGNCLFLAMLIAPDSWDEVGGRGSARAVNDRTLVVSATSRVHWQIEELLARLAAPSSRSPREQQLDRQLSAPARVVGSLATPNDVLLWLRAQDIVVRLDERELEEAGIDLDTSVAIQPSGASIEEVLQQAASGSDLAWQRKGEALVLTTEDQAENDLEVRVYDVSGLELVGDELIRCLDLVEPDSWDEVGGRGSRAETRYLGRRVLAVSQTQAAHRQIADLLERLPRGTTPAAVSSRPAERRYLRTPAWNTPRVFTASGENRSAAGPR